MPVPRLNLEPPQREWAKDAPRRKKAGVPEEIKFATKPAMALRQIEHPLEQGAPKHCVLTDAGYGVDTAFRERLSVLGLTYIVGVTGSVTVWAPGRRLDISSIRRSINPSSPSVS